MALCDGLYIIQWCDLGLETVSRRTNVSSRSRLFASRAQDVILPKLVWIKGSEYCTDFLSLSKQGVFAWSRLHVIAPHNLILRIIIINGRENKVTTALIITCRPRPILKSRWRLVTYKRFVTVSSQSRTLTSRAHSCYIAFCCCLTVSLSCTVSEILHFYNKRDCTWPWQVLHFRHFS